MTSSAKKSERNDLADKRFTKADQALLKAMGISGIIPGAEAPQPTVPGDKNAGTGARTDAYGLMRKKYYDRPSEDLSDEDD